MGQTLQNGIYLPAEGERNCYDGLEGNWRSLDGLISTVAGKASASHTHGNITTDGKLATADRVVITDSTKSFTTSSVTSSELSYLSGVTSAIQTQLNAKATDSDVVHKSGNETIAGVKTFNTNMYLNTNASKSFVFKNSNYTAGQAAPASGTSDIDNILFKDSTDTNVGIVGMYDNSDGSSYMRILARNKFANGERSTSGSATTATLDIGTDGTSKNYISVGASRLEPSSDNQFSLGTSSKKWKEIYSSNYYYGTTAWGLDKANTWTGDNTYSKTVAIERSTDTGNFLALKNTVADLGSTPASATPVTIAFRDKDNDNLGYMGVYYDTDGSNHFRLYVRNKYTSGAPSTTGSYDYAFFGLRLNADRSKEGIIKASFRPYDNNTHDLGSSSYQWNNLYAKNYYYNGTAWGLDKANVWSNLNIISYSGVPELRLKHTVLNINSAPTENCGIHINFQDSAGTNVSGVKYIKGPDGTTRLFCELATKDSNNTLISKTLRLDTNQNGTNWQFYPGSNADINLGTSTNKWKTLNGINPGALSLPGVGGFTDIKGDITNLSGGDNNFTAPYDGWVCVRSTNATVIHIINTVWAVCQSATQSNAGTLCCLCPVMSGQSFKVIVNATSLEYAYIHPCKGNVNV